MFVGDGIRGVEVKMSTSLNFKMRLCSHKCTCLRQCVVEGFSVREECRYPI